MVRGRGYRAYSVLVALCALLLCPASALAWNVSVPRAGILRVAQDVGDTDGTVTYYEKTAPAYSVMADGSWDSTQTGGHFYQVTGKAILFDGAAQSFELVCGSQAFLVVTPGGTWYVCAVSTYPLRVVLTDPGTLGTGNTVGIASTMNTVRTTGTTITATIPSTLTVDPWVTAGLPVGWIAVLAVCAVAGMGVLVGREFSR